VREEYPNKKEQRIRVQAVLLAKSSICWVSLFDIFPSASLSSFFLAVAPIFLV